MAVLDCVTLHVRDVSRSLAFYRVLGLPVPHCSPGATYASGSSIGGCRAEWVADRWSARSGSVRLGLRCASPDAVDVLVGHVQSAGYEVGVTPHDAPWGARIAQVVDPDGNAVELFAPYP